MSPPEKRSLQEQIADLEEELSRLSYELPRTDRDDRPAVLRKMWEVSGQIAEEKVRNVTDAPGRATLGFRRPG